MRGEKKNAANMKKYGTGSSPHARGKVIDQVKAGKMPRIIPACAGKRMEDYPLRSPV